MSEIIKSKRIEFSCAGLTYPFYLFQIFKILLFIFGDYLGILWIYPFIFYCFILILLMFLHRNYLRKKLIERLQFNFPKLKDLDIEIFIMPLIRGKTLLKLSLVYFLIILFLNIPSFISMGFINIFGVIFISSLYLFFLFAEYVLTIHCKPNTIVKLVTVYEFSHEGKKFIDKKDIYNEYKEILDEINEKAIGYIPLDKSNEDELNLIHIKNKLNSFNSKFENVTIESIFIIGLVLSGFFSIINTIDINIIKNTFIELLKIYSQIFFKVLNQQNNSNSLLNLLNFSKEEYYTIISVLTLICSTFYIMVLIMRLRINHIYIKAKAAYEELIFINNQYNYIKNDISTQKNIKNQLLKKRDFSLNSSERLANSLNTTSEFIVFYRELGLFIFYSIILISSFQLNLYFGIIITVFTILTNLIKKFEEILKFENIRYIISKY
ncbi:hypothetical protein ACSVH2_07435 [Flavobacterium sp. RSB2_4_14]|uniref:hypothetical protein n=1 Tax=Flavobacterium sp. RSB2_4_14 TaxID=3447665 RepID=UPI003F3F812A